MLVLLTSVSYCIAPSSISRVQSPLYILWLYSLVHIKVFLLQTMFLGKVTVELLTDCEIECGLAKTKRRSADCSGIVTLCKREVCGVMMRSSCYLIYHYLDLLQCSQHCQYYSYCLYLYWYVRPIAMLACLYFLLTSCKSALVLTGSIVLRSQLAHFFLLLPIKPLSYLTSLLQRCAVNQVLT